ncbi:hypothetical protein NBM05_12050 [Rothia sp. AR01]|uniref:Membrane protein YkvI n=1 Tax=Rothia santali TaxID=2949643 RepID=A0A9X2KJC5_9MICC|nr:hypothetical protein [Rothia santali]MCP3426714.1 hypothetical protein [Rothia santali]
MKEQVKISLAFVGLLVGAGFATGLEVVQYFISFGLTGLWGVLLAGVVMTAAGAAILQLGSYFLAREHNGVFREIAHPLVSRTLDLAVILTLFCVGFVMLAGAGSNLEQQFGLPTWAGALIMLLLVATTGLLDVDKVSSIISGVTPLLIVAVLTAFGYTLLHLPDDFGQLSRLAAEEASPVSPWWLSALNYNGLALMLGVSMSLVIGGSHSSLKATGRGGLYGGILYTVLLAMAAFTLLANIDGVAGDDVPMLSLFESMHPVLATIMTFVIFAMIYNTAIGMFYALGKRVTASRPNRYVPVFLGLCAAGYAVSFVGFETLMTYVYPVIGYLGLAMVALLVGWWLKSRRRFTQESGRRERIRDLEEQRGDDGRPFSAEDQSELDRALAESHVDSDRLEEVVTGELSLRDIRRAREDGASDSETEERDAGAEGSETDRPDAEGTAVH